MGDYSVTRFYDANSRVEYDPSTGQNPHQAGTAQCTPPKNPMIATFLTKFIIPLFVYGAEKYLRDLSGDEKREYVLTLFGKLNLNVDPDAVRLILESACEKLDIEQGKYVQSAATLIEGATEVIKDTKKK